MSATTSASASADGFLAFLRKRIATGQTSTEDVLASFLPLAKQVLEAHRRLKVAPLRGLDALRVEGVVIWFEEAKLEPPRSNRGKIERLERPESRSVEILSETERTTEVGAGISEVRDLAVGEPGVEVTRPMYLTGYTSWEQELGHHDPLTDVFSLGMILASLSCLFDFTELEDLRSFVSCRRNLFLRNPNLHPVVAKAILRMTDSRRHRRAQDLEAVVHNLENYRGQDIDFGLQLARETDFGKKNVRDRRHVILDKLQERLFEFTRRNRLLHFRQTGQSVNLTHASVPLSFDPRSIRADQILTWGGRFERDVLRGKPVNLDKYLNFIEALYLPSLLDRIRSESRRDQAEFGFAQLRVVICFLRWYNLKEKSKDRFDSPFLLVPVTLTKKKGIRDSYWIEPLGTEAEVNPVLRHYLKGLFDIDLPETIDLEQTRLDAVFDELAKAIRASEPGIELVKVDQPRIDLIHDRARRRLDQYQRLRIGARAFRSFGEIDYSYSPENLRPLGLRLFQEHIRRPLTHIREVVQETPSPRQYAVPAPGVPEPVSEKKRTFYALRDKGDDNPYHWELDLTSVTLGNFRYRKMSLVRDYLALRDRELENPAFDSLFSLEPRHFDDGGSSAIPVSERFHVVAGDPTQISAIGLARSGRSYIIQGPPGTGKSQTITNLIADFVARGKRVLFVCEKRAAIDVVYHRLRQKGLDSLCTLIHDALADKKEFVMDLKRSYEALQKEGAAANWEGRREKLQKHLESELSPLARHHEAMTGKPPRIGVPLYELLHGSVATAEHRPELSVADAESLPSFAEWHRNRESIEEIAATLSQIGADGVLARHPLRELRTGLAREERPARLVSEKLAEAESLFETLEAVADESQVDLERATLPDLRNLGAHAQKVSELVRLGLSELLDRASERSKRFDEELEALRAREAERAKAVEQTRPWRKKLAREEVATALELARALRGKALGFLAPAWWRLRNVLRAHYDFSAHAIAPSWTQILEKLEQEYALEDAVASARASLARRYRLTDDVEAFAAELRALREGSRLLSPALAAFHQSILNEEIDEEAIRRLAAPAVGEAADELEATLAFILEDLRGAPLAKLHERLSEIDAALDTLPDFLHCLAELEALPPETSAALRTLPLTTSQIEAAVRAKALEDVYREDRALGRFDDGQRRRHVAKLDRLYDELQRVNAAVVRERVSRRFLENIKLASRPASQLDAREKELKNEYTRGRRALEHEFGKVMRFKSIRDLVSGESGIVVRDLKPVWLMSPLSVSDTLPLDSSWFDVVIFDEASQVTLEEAVPAVARAPQVIVVGDEMQLPPTNFFSAKRAEDEESLLIEEGGEVYEYDLECNSFLSHVGRNLPSKMLGWHYRSRSESLISFSNWAFYRGHLLTVPERGGDGAAREEIRAEAAEDGASNLEKLLERPVSFHFMSHGVYENRRNRAEAEYIAEMVRALLLKDAEKGAARPSIGIVAFSEAQQDEIEQALERRARQDRAFRDRLEAEREREEDSQFAGLLVKNLENIQGDERDIIIMSICYGYGPDARMLMNFGPINQNGGEKRLNVAFSRAREHMALVSSIHDSDIKNDYNDGANCLKRYLAYAAASSEGRPRESERVLMSMVLEGEAPRTEVSEATVPLMEALEQAIVFRGYAVVRGLGQSRFRCDLAVRRPEDASFTLAIFIDHDGYYAQNDILERDLLRPKLLRAFGWRVAHVLAKDWYDDRERVLDYLEKQLTSEKEPTEDVEDVELALDSAGNGTRTRSHAAAPKPEPTVPELDNEPAWTATFERRSGPKATFWEIVAGEHQYRVHEWIPGSLSRGEYRLRTFTSPAAMEEQATRAMAQRLALGYEWVDHPSKATAAASLPPSTETQGTPEPEDASEDELPDVLKASSSRRDPAVDRRRLPPMWNRATLPRPVLAANGRALPLEAVERLGKLIAGTSLETKEPGLDEVRKACLPGSLEAFCASLFRQWLDVGAPMRHKWPLVGFGQLAGEAAARHLTPYILEWPHEGGAARAALGLNVLEQVGGDVALMYAQWVGRWARTKGLKKNVSEMMARIAAARGLKKSRVKELEDTAPELGFDAGGRSELFELGDEDEAHVHVREGIEVTPEIERQLEALRVDVSTLIALHRLRLEKAMCSRHRFSSAAFRERLCGHPVLRRLTERLVWQMDGPGVKPLPVRLVDGAFQDVDGRELDLSAGASVFLPHPLELDPKLLERFRATFDGAGIRQPFAQLHRAFVPMTRAERASHVTDRVAGVQTSFERLLRLAALGWRPESDYTRLGTFGEPIRKRVGSSPWHVYVDVDKNGVLGTAKLIEGNSWTMMIEVSYGQLDPIQFSEMFTELELARA